MRCVLRIAKITFTLLLALSFASCGKKSDRDLFDEGEIRIDLSASPKMGYRPLEVDFNAYLETDERTVDKRIEEVKWVIRGPRGYEREIVQGSQNFQDEEANKESFFYFNYSFNLPGKYTIQLFLNENEFRSPKVSVTVLDRPDENPSRF